MDVSWAHGVGTWKGWRQGFWGSLQLGLTLCWMAACLRSISRFSTAESITSWSSCRGKASEWLWSLPGHPSWAPRAYLSGQLLHVGVELV